jgi:hypothetical protein
MDGTAAEWRGNDGRFSLRGPHGAQCSRFASQRTTPRHPAGDALGAGVAVVLFAAVLVWSFVTAPNGQLGGTTRPRPTPSTGVLGGYQGDDYLIVGDRLIIVDPGARRVTAIVPNIG